jgi:hypothetical protein
MFCAGVGTQEQKAKNEARGRVRLLFLNTEQCRPFLNLDDEDTPAFQTASKNSQLFPGNSG